MTRQNSMETLKGFESHGVESDTPPTWFVQNVSPAFWGGFRKKFIDFQQTPP
jgi:hypothetical protein